MDMDLNHFKALKRITFKDKKNMPSHKEDHAGKLLFLDSPALTVFKDYRESAPLIMLADIDILSVKKKMSVSNKDVALVIDSTDNVSGVISNSYIESSAMNKLIQKSGLSLKDITANDVKKPISDVYMLHYDTIQDAKIGHILKTMVEEEVHKVLVYDEIDNEPFIRGHFSLSNITHILDLDLHITKIDKTLR